MESEDNDSTTEQTGTENTELNLDSTSTTTDEKDTTTEVQSGEATKDASDGAGDSTYEPFTLPDDWQISDDDLAAFTTVAQDMELDQDGAQKLVDLFIAVRQGQEGETSDAESVDGPEQWQEKLHADTDLGGDNLSQTQANVNMAVTLMDDVTLEYFKSTGEHFRPEILPFLNKIGSMMQEDSANLGGDRGPGGDGKTQAQNMFAKSGHV